MDSRTSQEHKNGWLNCSEIQNCSYPWKSSLSYSGPLKLNQRQNKIWIKHWGRNQETHTLVPALSLTSCVTLGKLVSPSGMNLLTLKWRYCTKFKFWVNFQSSKKADFGFLPVFSLLLHRSRFLEVPHSRSASPLLFPLISSA